MKIYYLDYCLTMVRVLRFHLVGVKMNSLSGAVFLASCHLISPDTLGCIYHKHTLSLHMKVIVLPLLELYSLTGTAVLFRQRYNITIHKTILHATCHHKTIQKYH